MILLFLDTIELNCFTDTTLVVLSKQSRQPTFTATLLTDNSKDALVCNQLASSPLQISLDFDGFIYTYPTLTTLQKAVDLTFPCTDVNNCDAAFLATSVAFKIVFPDTSTVSTDVVSVFKIDKYNRLSCLSNQQISYTTASKLIQISADAGACKFQLISAQSATVKLFVYPDLVIEKQYPLAAVANLQDLLTNMVINCNTDFTGTQKRICERIVAQFEELLNNKAELTISLPAVIPDASATYSRQSEFQIFTHIVAISSSFVKDYDCYTSQKATVFRSMLLMQYVLNPASVHCVLPVDQFIGAFDRTVFTISITDSDSTSVEFEFTSTFKNQQTTAAWLECSSEASGQQSCITKIEQFKKMKNPTSIISREFMNGPTITKQVQNSVEMSTSKYANAVARLNQTQFCFNTTNNGDTNAFYPVQIQFAAGEPRYFPSLHTEKLVIQDQVYFPGNAKAGESAKYCFNVELSPSQKEEYVKLYQAKESVTGTIEFLGQVIAIEKLQIVQSTQDTDYMYVLAAVLVISSIIWFAAQKMQK
ncbi:Hypothetical_protein [Hexamita inflata]|uniref:Hypothetical_protein n=1 Tax=Hexamita inflata TaxID=28002 RepID=A0AA86UYQ8_9EUKA|nr:Hypothetical protein HINF_LOCUS40743 [Hexamita inflata]